jgi:hypothetical protein
VVRLDFCGWRVPDQFEEPAGIEPLDPFEVVNATASMPRQGMPRRGAACVDHLNFALAGHRLGKDIVVAVTDTADGGIDASFCQPLGICNGFVPAPAIAVVATAIAVVAIAMVHEPLRIRRRS